MSGIVGIVNLDGSPIDREVLGRMTDFMSFRGPDAQEIWIEGNVGFGHTMLRTTFEAETEKQPLTLDGKVWLTADARIDGRTELTAELEGKLRRKIMMPLRSDEQGSFNGQGAESRIPNDAELILLAYEAWGEDCVKHLIGDFAFAIWDSRERRLLCARDHFGVKPFYYAHIGSTFIFSNTLNCVRQHPKVSSELNEVAVGDYLLCGNNCEPTTTIFADIVRLPGAHSLNVSTAARSARCYWSLPADFHLSYKDSKDYPEQFRALLSRSVRDRLRTNHVAAEISGGLDSTAVVATAKQLLTGYPSDSITTFCLSYEHLIPDQERYYASLAAQTLEVPIQHIIGDHFPLFEIDVSKPEPFNLYPFSAISTELIRRMSLHGRVALTGWDGDALISEAPRHYFRFLLKRGQLSRLAWTMSWYARTQGKLPPMGMRTSVLRLRGKYPPRQPYPVWLDPAFEARAALRKRWEQIHAATTPAHPTRPTLFSVLSSPNLARLFESYDAGLTGLCLEARHPMTDFRVVEFLLRLPPVPWCVNKYIVRTAMSNALPMEILRRPKTPLAGDPVIGVVANGTTMGIDRFESHTEVNRYFRRTAVPPVAGEKETYQLWMNLRPFSLNLWLQSANN